MNIPAVFTSFVGRTHELTAVTALLASSRLVTLTGPAGCGKTRLAIRAADNVRSRLADGVCWVDLAPLTDPDLVLPSVAKAVHVVEGQESSVKDNLLETLRDQQILLVLDNCEHLLDACRQLVEVLLLETAEVRVLATSRETLGVTGEVRYPVPPLAIPPADRRELAVEQYEAIQLFVERVRGILPDFVLTPDLSDAAAQICQQLDGLPLAIELASARMNVLTIKDIATRLEDRFRLLSRAPHLTHSPHQTLRAALDWSYDLLRTPEQVMLRRLSVFVGGCSLTTAEVICVGDGIQREQVLELLSSLVDKSLVLAQTLDRHEARYVLLETIRQYAYEKLLTAGEEPTVRNRHLAYFLKQSEETVSKLIGPDQQRWLSSLEGEYDNIRAALAWALEARHIEAGLRIALAVYPFWTIRDYVSEGLGWLERLMGQADDTIAPVFRANALAYASFLAGFRGNTAAQTKYGQEAAVLAAAAGDEGKRALAWALSGQAYAARAAGDYPTELTLARQAIQLYRELGDKYFLGLSLSIASFSAMSLGHYGDARQMLDEALVLLREAGNPYRIAMALNFSGDLARCEHKYAQARTAYEESIVLLRDLDAVRDLASALQNLGHTCLHLGDVERAHTLFSESLAIQQAQRNTPGVAECLIGFAAAAAVSGLPGAGARLLAAAVSLGGQRIVTAWAATRLEYEHYLALIRSGLTETEFQTAQAAGRALALDQAVVFVQTLPLRSAAQAIGRDRPGDLTVRERDVTILIAQGKSNGEIADELVISKRTVETHISNILSKLGFTNRAQIVRWAIETGLVSSAP